MGNEESVDSHICSTERVCVFNWKKNGGNEASRGGTEPVITVISTSVVRERPAKNSQVANSLWTY